MLVKAAGSLKTIEIRGRYEGMVTPMEVLRYQEMRLRLPEGKARELDGFLREQFARRRDGACLEGGSEPPHSIPNETVAQPKVLEGKVLVTVQAEPNERVKVTVDYDEPALWLFVASLCSDIEAEWSAQSEKCDDPDCHYTAYAEYIGIYGLPAIVQTPASATGPQPEATKDGGKDIEAQALAEPIQAVEPTTPVAEQTPKVETPANGNGESHPWDVIEVDWQREAVRLWCEEKLSSPSIGDRLNFSPKTVLNRLSELRKKHGPEVVPTDDMRKGRDMRDKKSG